MIYIHMLLIIVKLFFQIKKKYKENENLNFFYGREKFDNFLLFI